jgi:hypothetical protein
VRADQISFARINAYKGTAVLILGGCTASSGDYFLDESTFKNICPFFMPRHTSDQRQPSGLLLFGKFKGTISQAVPGSPMSNQSRRIGYIEYG